MTDIIDQLAKRVNDLVSEIESVAKARHRVTVEHFDGDESNPSLDATDDAENSDDDEYDEEDGVKSSREKVPSSRFDLSLTGM
jgi:hypothetical protein